MVGEEPDPPYERPPLSKEYLRGETEFEQSLVQPLDWYEDNEVELLLGVRADAVDPTARAVELEDRRRIRYDKVLIATGGRNRTLSVPGSELGGIFGLRTRADADRIRDAAQGAVKVVVVGMGFIGAEVAASLRQKGLSVSVVEVFSVPLERVLGRMLGRVVLDLHAEHGVEVILEDTVVAFEGAGVVERVVTRKGRFLDADLVVVGVGIQPNTDVVEGSGVEIDNGIVVDEFCATNVEGIYACGDVANHFHPLTGTRMRVEHWQNAIRQGAAAARTMMGSDQSYEEVHWFWSDQYDTNIQYAGFHEVGSDLVLRGSPADRDFVGFFVNEGRLRAAVGFNRRREIRSAMRLIQAGIEVNSEALVDEGVDLREMLGSGGES